MRDARNIFTNKPTFVLRTGMYHRISLHQLLFPVCICADRFDMLAEGFTSENDVASVFSVMVEISDGFGVSIRRAFSKITKHCLGEEATRFHPRWHVQTVHCAQPFPFSKFPGRPVP